MALPKISSQEQRKIEVLIHKWKGKLTWATLVERAELELGIRVTRQTLCTYTGILHAYKDKKNQLRGVPSSMPEEVTVESASLARQIENLKAEIVIFERKNNEQLRLIERILSNAREIPNLDLRTLIKKRPEEMNNG
ncbi:MULTISPECIES: hypothetical protein [Halomonadaceae]|uniref:Uncharacterized protein n=3 Tax=root TaxID=1 RepID=A0AAP9NMK3_9GAMM|nr:MULTISPECIES: hypothetical protein [Halomonas]TDV96856.1 hypothetical protein BDK62_109141 [Halomonas alkaliantarctica]MCE7520043.1 hypothetical protein [Halomonas titanicae]MCH4812601.1 hypothetical protein [Halomonas neptunia]PKG50345.1 hypothetical protein CXF87_11250 [Halomonas sp. MES3-P3E]QKS25078.1 hypothetical protein FX987_02866 [Halomonas titanicae]|tara:strand:- start:4244 stop:4654 length:411 start_codon:yes stop_codon:yes gene_type:complete